MRFIHTADLHLGNKMHDVNREEEYIAFFQWLTEILTKQEAETLVISGDVYDTINPPLESRKIFNQFLAGLLGTDCKNVIIVGGNHDSGALLDSNKDLMEALNIHIVGSISNRQVSDIVFPLYDKEDQLNGICVAVPFLKESDLRRFYTKKEDDEQEKADDSDQAYGVLYEQALDIAKAMRGSKNVPIIATGHLYAADLEGRYAQLENGEKPDDGVRVIDVLGNLGSVHVGAFPADYDYVALGHIHYHTKVAGNPKVRYSGSPFVMGFDESYIPRQVLFVECEEGKETAVEPMEVPSNYKYRTFTGDADTLKQQLKELEKSAKEEEQVYIEVRYRLEHSGQVNRMIQEIELPENMQIVSTKIIRNTNSHQTSLGNRTMREMRELDPKEIFESFILSKLFSDGDDDKKQEQLDKYMPYFMGAYAEVMGGAGDEDC